MPGNRHHIPRQAGRQEGAVLIVSLLILTVMTIIGLSAVSNTTMEERMASNSQTRSTAFQAAESGLAGVMRDETAFFDGIENGSTTRSYSLGTSTSSQVQVQYDGVATPTQCPGTGQSVTCHRYVLTSDGNLTGGPTVTNVQGALYEGGGAN